MWEESKDDKGVLCILNLVTLNLAQLSHIHDPSNAHKLCSTYLYPMYSGEFKDRQFDSFNPPPTPIPSKGLDSLKDTECMT